MLKSVRRLALVLFLSDLGCDLGLAALGAQSAVGVPVSTGALSGPHAAKLQFRWLGWLALERLGLIAPGEELQGLRVPWGRDWGAAVGISKSRYLP